MPRVFSLSYESSGGTVIGFDTWPLRWDDSDLQSYTWKVSTVKRSSGYGSKITDIGREATSKKIKLKICDYGNDVAVYTNYLASVFEPDVIAKTPGKLWINDSYTTGFVTAMDLGKRIERQYLELTLTFSTEYPFWITEDLHTFEPLTEGSATGFILPTALPMAIVAPRSRLLVNDHYSPCSAIITMYGPVSDPEFSLGSHVYSVTGSLSSGDRIEIDQKAKTVTKISSSGERLNFFYARGKTYSVFEPIPAGENYITYSNDFTFEILLLKERSDPEWTSLPADGGSTLNVWTGTTSEFALMTPVAGTVYFVE